MAFTCKPCHKRPMASYCATMFEIGRADSYGSCENCGVPSACMDCRCETKREDMPDPQPRMAPASEACMNECCDDCPGETEDGETCRDLCHDPAVKAAVAERDRIVRQATWQRCPACGKTGDHTHYSKPSAPGAVVELLGDFVEGPTGRVPKDTLDAVMDDVVRWRRKMLLTDYNYGTAEMRVLARMLGLNDEQLDTLGMKVLEAFPGIKRFCAVYAVHGDIVFDVETEATDPEHEPGNPNCLCFQPSCLPVQDYEGV